MDDGSPLHSWDVVKARQKLIAQQREPVADAEIGPDKGQPFLQVYPIPGDGELHTTGFLPEKQVADGLNRMQLEIEVGLESQLHHGRLRPVSMPAP